MAWCDAVCGVSGLDLKACVYYQSSRYTFGVEQLTAPCLPLPSHPPALKRARAASVHKHAAHAHDVEVSSYRFYMLEAMKRSIGRGAVQGSTTNGFCAFLNLVSSARLSIGNHSRLERIGHDPELGDDLVQRLGAMHNVVARAGVDRVGGSLLLAHNKDVVVPSVTRHTTVLHDYTTQHSTRHALLELRLSDLLSKLVVGEVHVNEEASTLSQIAITKPSSTHTATNCNCKRCR